MRKCKWTSGGRDSSLCHAPFDVCRGPFGEIPNEVAVEVNHPPDIASVIKAGDDKLALVKWIAGDVVRPKLVDIGHHDGSLGGDTGAAGTVHADGTASGLVAAGSKNESTNRGFTFFDEIEADPRKPLSKIGVPEQIDERGHAIVARTEARGNAARAEKQLFVAALHPARAISGALALALARSLD